MCKPKLKISLEIQRMQKIFDKAQKQEIASYVSQQKELLQFCWKEASMIDGPSTEESIEKLTMALFLSAQRHFKLA